MNYLIDKALEITPQLHRPSFFCRYVDDCFATFTEPTSFDIFFNNLNCIHKQIQFTKEIESNNSLAFLDVIIGKSDSGINTSTYHQPTHTDLFLKYSSFSPIRYKRNLINNLLQRSFTICNSYLKIYSEFQSTKTTLMRNEYPSRFIDRCIRQFLNKKFSQHSQTQTQTCNHFTFKLPYLGNISHNIKKELQLTIKKQLPDSKLRFIHATTKLEHYFHTKDPQSHLRRSNVIYRLNCSCGSFYIGQTRTNLIKRLQDHQTSDISEACNHIQSNTDHKVDFNNPQILTHSPDKYKLLVPESLFVQQLKPDLNLDSTSFPLHLFNA